MIKGYYIMIKGSIQEEDITIVNIYAPNIGVPQYIRQTLTDINGENDNRNTYINNYSKYKWIKCPNQKTQTG